MCTYPWSSWCRRDRVTDLAVLQPVARVGLSGPSGVNALHRTEIPTGSCLRDIRARPKRTRTHLFARHDRKGAGPWDIDEKGEYPPEALDAMAAVGLFGMKSPKGYGGLGQGITTVLERV